jgi:hypothetical protein
MLKSNSKEAIERIKDYVCNNVNFDTDTVNEKYYYVMDLEKRHENGENIDMFSVYAHALYNIMYEEVIAQTNIKRSFQDSFVYWCEGLPSCFDTGYYYNRSAVDDLGDILEQTEMQRHKYSEAEAEEKLSQLIFREIFKVIRKSYNA